MDTKGITYFNFLPSNNFTPLHNRLITMVSVYNYGCSYGAKFKLLYSEKHFHIQRKFSYIQKNIFIFKVIFLCLKKFSKFREIPYLKELRNRILSTILVWSLFCLIRLYVGLNLLRFLLENQSFVYFLCFLCMKTFKCASSCFEILICNFVLTLYKKLTFYKDLL